MRRCLRSFASYARLAQDAKPPINGTLTSSILESEPGHGINGGLLDELGLETEAENQRNQTTVLGVRVFSQLCVSPRDVRKISTASNGPVGQRILSIWPERDQTTLSESRRFFIEFAEPMSAASWKKHVKNRFCGHPVVVYDMYREHLIQKIPEISSYDNCPQGNAVLIYGFKPGNFVTKVSKVLKEYELEILPDGVQKIQENPQKYESVCSKLMLSQGRLPWLVRLASHSEARRVVRRLHGKEIPGETSRPLFVQIAY